MFKRHALVNNPYIGMLKYFYINIVLRVNKKPILVKWLNGLKYNLMLGDLETHQAVAGWTEKNL